MEDVEAKIKRLIKEKVEAEEQAKKWHRIAYELHVLNIYGTHGTARDIGEQAFSEKGSNELYEDAKEIIAREYGEVTS